MTYKLRERENMPEISAAALNMLNNYPATKKISQPAQSNKATINETCKSCNQQYNKTTLDSILAKLPSLSNAEHNNHCLNCIKESIQVSKSAKYPRLRELRQDLDEITIVYQTIYNKWKSLSKEYQALDYQENMITHEQTVKVPIKKPASEKKQATNAQTNTALAMKILANLSPEQQAAVLANIKAQSNQ